MINADMTDASPYFIFEFDEHKIFDTNAKICSYAEYQDGWCYGDGVKFSDEVLNAIAEINTLAIVKGFLNTDAFSGLDGDTKLTVYHKNIRLEFNFNSDSTIDFIREESDNEDVELTLNCRDEAKKIINKFAEEIWLQGYYVPTGTSENVMVSWTTPSNLPVDGIAA